MSKLGETEDKTSHMWPIIARLRDENELLQRHKHGLFASTSEAVKVRLRRAVDERKQEIRILQALWDYNLAALPKGQRKRFQEAMINGSDK